MGCVEVVLRKPYSLKLQTPFEDGKENMRRKFPTHPSALLEAIENLRIEQESISSTAFTPVASAMLNTKPCSKLGS